MRNGRGRIVVDGVWKRFRRGEHDSLRDLLPALGRKLLGRGTPPDELEGNFWALCDVSFSVGPGEVLGIIGPNGAGKSTLLKLLTGILKPDRGRMEVRGKVGALIEVAAGFHGDLTGRENIFLQGAVMGLSRSEVARRFDEIVDFSGVEAFIDTPVKRYSSGMCARLGFSVAAFMDPDVLLVDEVLSVGDLAFERKALARLQELVQREIPVIMVSHQLERITRVCTDALLLVEGEVAFAGSPEASVSAYFERQHHSGPAGSEGAPVQVTSLEGIPDEAAMEDELAIRICGNVRDLEHADDAVVGLRIRALPGEDIVFATSMLDFDLHLPGRESFQVELQVCLHLVPGRYRVQAVVWRKADRREWARGPSAILQVTGERRARGWAHLEPRMRLLGS